ncbi:MAG: NAD(P)(+) transhydrogenase (Re/Si-specific) subunit alpha, partial [Chloroflexi bacterium]|nr:NAD(P)(+) transhydrogenase (Re/Si-specific) subunit alpha [Chloroflexota bacterium]
MIIGIPKEIMPGERRVAGTPETVKAMKAIGLEVLVEKDAGEGAYFHDPDYVTAGAEIVADPSEIFNRADMILKVKEPQFNRNLNLHEVDMMHENQFLITFFHPA